MPPAELVGLVGVIVVVPVTVTRTPVLDVEVAELVVDVMVELL